MSSEEDYTPFDDVNDLLEPEEIPARPIHVVNDGKYEVFRLYDASGSLLYITRSAQLHKFKDKPWWPLVVNIQINRHATPGRAEDDKILGIDQEAPKWNVLGANL